MSSITSNKDSIRAEKVAKAKAHIEKGDGRTEKKNDGSLRKRQEKQKALVSPYLPLWYLLGFTASSHFSFIDIIFWIAYEVSKLIWMTVCLSIQEAAKAKLVEKQREKKRRRQGKEVVEEKPAKKRVEFA